MTESIILYTMYTVGWSRETGDRHTKTVEHFRDMKNNKEYLFGEFQHNSIMITFTLKEYS